MASSLRGVLERAPEGDPMRTAWAAWGAALVAVVASGCSESLDIPNYGGGPAAGAGGIGGTGGGGGAAPLSLAPGEVAELVVDGSGVSGERLATPNGDEQFVVILASTKIDLSDKMYDYALDLEAAPAAGSGSLATGCSLTNDPWSTTELSDEPPPSGTGPTVGDTRTVNVQIPTGFEAITPSCRSF